MLKEYTLGNLVGGFGMLDYQLYEDKKKSKITRSEGMDGGRELGDTS